MKTSRSLMTAALSTVGAISLGLSFLPSANAAVFYESLKGNAGRSAKTAMLADTRPEGTPLTVIDGELTDHVDLFEIELTGNRFRATTQNGDFSADTQLFLFKKTVTKSGKALAIALFANDDANTTRSYSLLDIAANRLTPGRYYLGVTSNNVSPIGSRGRALFPNRRVGQVSALGKNLILKGWKTRSSNSIRPFSYKISLLGATFARPNPQSGGSHHPGPTPLPTYTPKPSPIPSPTYSPDSTPTPSPSHSPSPTSSPSPAPSPSNSPTPSPSNSPGPSPSPSNSPTPSPSNSPSPTPSPTNSPTPSPSNSPSPTPSPTNSPTPSPSNSPSPTPSPSNSPTPSPSNSPSPTPSPSNSPTPSPSNSPSPTPSPSNSPTPSPSNSPSPTPSPSNSPTPSPSNSPSPSPTPTPFNTPTPLPSPSPSTTPTPSPSPSPSSTPTPTPTPTPEMVSVPEPSSMLGLMLTAGLGWRFFRKRHTS